MLINCKNNLTNTYLSAKLIFIVLSVLIHLLMFEDKVLRKNNQFSLMLRMSWAKYMHSFEQCRNVEYSFVILLKIPFPVSESVVLILVSF